MAIIGRNMQRLYFIIKNIAALDGNQLQFYLHGQNILWGNIIWKMQA
jgi:hypothetical protein